MKHGYEILNHNWNLSPLSGSMQLLLARKNVAANNRKLTHDDYGLWQEWSDSDRVPPWSTVTVAYYRKFLQDVLCPKICRKRSDMFAASVLILHDNARSHASGAVSEILEKYGWQVLPHPPYSPEMSPPDFDLFPKLKKPLRGKNFRSTEETSNEVTWVIRRINNEGVLTGIQDLPKRRTTVIKHNGDYIEGL